MTSRGTSATWVFSLPYEMQELPFPDERVYWYTTEERRYLLDYGHTDILEHFCQFYLRDCTSVVCYNDEIADRFVRYLLRIWPQNSR